MYSSEILWVLFSFSIVFQRERKLFYGKSTVTVSKDNNIFLEYYTWHDISIGWEEEEIKNRRGALHSEKSWGNRTLTSLDLKGVGCINLYHFWKNIFTSRMGLM